MTQFDARVVARNAKSNKVIDGIVASLKKNGATRVEINMADRVIRPFAHIMNECEINDVDPAKVLEATVSAATTMFSEYLIRTIPAGNTTLVQAAVQTVLDEFTEALLSTVGANFGVEFEKAQPAATPPSPLLHS